MKKLRTHDTSINLLFFTLFFLFKHSSCLDPWFNICVPKDCGDGLNISYPFFINGLQNSSCGFPGFELNCRNNSSILRISDTDFIVKHIDTKTRKIRLQNAAISSNSTEFCQSKLRNLTLDPNQFVIDESTTTKLVFVSNCSNSVSRVWERYRIKLCEDRNRMEFVMAASDWSMRNVTDGCSEIVEMPVEAVDGVVVDGRNYTEVVKLGFWMRWLASDCGECQRSGGKCGFNMTSYRFLCFCEDRPRSGTCITGVAGRENNWILKVVAGVGTPLLSFLLIWTICYIKKFSLINYIATFIFKSEDDISVEAFIKQYGSLTTKRYTYANVKKMTNSFQVKLGGGGFGTVYQGELSDGRFVAVKVLNSSKASGNEFINEVASIGRISHVNIVSLLGFCSDNHKRALIYEFMPNGSLEKLIISSDDSESSNIRLETTKLYEVALGIARGLDYLHRGCNPRILHLDIKPANILLDDQFCPKIADFGLAKLYSKNESIVSMLDTRGTIGYIAPEVFNRNIGGVSHKSDVYSYGMLILEMVGGNKKVSVGVGSKSTSDSYFPYWIYNRVEDEKFVFEGVSSVEENEYVRKMTIVGLWCIQTVPTQRPSIIKVIEMLEGNMGALEVPKKPSFSSFIAPEVDTYSTSQSELRE